MRKLIFVWIYFTCFAAGAQDNSFGKNQKEETVKSIEVEKKTLYIVCRGTRSKSFVIAKQFNLKDSVATHAGIGFVQNNEFKIFNITNEKIPIRIESFSSFILNDDVYYVGLWKIRVSSLEYKRAIDFINMTIQRNIRFDYDFKLNNGDSLYCSELCVLVLKFANRKKFNFQPTIKKLNDPLICNVLKRKTLSYYPVDFFSGNRNFSLAGSYFFHDEK